MTKLTFSLAHLPGLDPGSKASRVLLAKLCALKPGPVARYSAAEAKQAGLSFEEIVSVFSVAACEDEEIERCLRLWATDCAARVLHIYERSETSTVPRQAIETARRFLRREVDFAARYTACKAAMDLVQEVRMAAPRRPLWPAREAARAAADAAWAVIDDPMRCVATPWTGLWDSAAAVARIAAETAAKSAARGHAIRDAGEDTAGDKERSWQYDRLVARLSDPEPEDWPLPARWCPPAKRGPQQRPVPE